MRALPSLSAWLSGLSRRERLFVTVGAGILALTFAITLVVLPEIDRWSAREATLDAKGRVRGRKGGVHPAGLVGLRRLGP